MRSGILPRCFANILGQAFLPQRKSKLLRSSDCVYGLMGLVNLPARKTPPTLCCPTTSSKAHKRTMHLRAPSDSYTVVSLCAQRVDRGPAPDVVICVFPVDFVRSLGFLCIARLSSAQATRLKPAYGLLVQTYQKSGIQGSENHLNRC